MMCCAEARDDDSVIQLADILKSVLPDQLNSLLFASNATNSVSVNGNEIDVDAQTPQFDNDHPFDFRRIGILPTPAEIEYRSIYTTSSKCK